MFATISPISPSLWLWWLEGKDMSEARELVMSGGGGVGGGVWRITNDVEMLLLSYSCTVKLRKNLFHQCRWKRFTWYIFQESNSFIYKKWRRVPCSYLYLISQLSDHSLLKHRNVSNGRDWQVNSKTFLIFGSASGSGFICETKAWEKESLSIFFVKDKLAYIVR